MAKNKGQADWKTKFRIKKISKVGFWSSGWTALEIAKLVVGSLTPILIAWYGQKLTSERDQSAEVRATYSQVIQKRVALWDKISLDLNDIYCYFLFVGRWKDFSPSQIISKKRNVDSAIYSNRPFFLIDLSNSMRPS